MVVWRVEELERFGVDELHGGCGGGTLIEQGVLLIALCALLGKCGPWTCLRLGSGNSGQVLGERPVVYYLWAMKIFGVTVAGLRELKQ